LGFCQNHTYCFVGFVVSFFLLLAVAIALIYISVVGHRFHPAEEPTRPTLNFGLHHDEVRPHLTPDEVFDSDALSGPVRAHSNVSLDTIFGGPFGPSKRLPHRHLF
jgi:hypothetical protein